MHGDIPGWSPCLGERVRVKRTDQFGIVAQITDGWDPRLYVIELEGTSGAPVPAVGAASGAGDGRATYVLEELERGQ